MTEKVRKLAELHDKDAQISDRYYIFATPVSESRVGGDLLQRDQVLQGR